ncbi:MAG: hypothetical protein KGN00_08605 [Chloroflexota bacterium]|nr:hypothetical protein [Chloroflexota bacterium]MDE3193729.1 hypothetical protein [Chloroflexota bacterium]
MSLERDVALATEHPRGTELKRLGPYRDALRAPAAYAALPEADRDAIVRWVEVRRQVKERSGLDHDDANLADPLVPLARLRAHVVDGERIAAGLAAVADPGGDVVAVVASIRARGAG